MIIYPTTVNRNKTSGALNSMNAFN